MKPTIQALEIVNEEMINFMIPTIKVYFKVVFEFNETIYTRNFDALYQYYMRFGVKEDWKINNLNIRVQTIPLHIKAEFKDEIYRKAKSMLMEKEKEILKKEVESKIPEITNYKIEWSFYKSFGLIPIFFSIKGEEKEFLMTIESHGTEFVCGKVRYKVGEKYADLDKIPNLSWQDDIFEYFTGVLKKDPKFRVRQTVNHYKNIYRFGGYSKVKEQRGR